MNLRDKLEQKQEQRARFNALQDWLRARLKEIQAAPPYVETSFWCDYCKKDFEGVGHKEIRMPTNSVWLAYYVGLCPCGKFALRYITDKLQDPYYYRSEVIKRQQAQHSDDMLQPYEPRFRLIYPRQYAKLMHQEQGSVV